jgi:hypothetical protein
MRRSLRRITRSNPLPPCLPILQSQNPFHTTCLVLCYWQPTEAQQLARVGQTRGDGMVRLMLGGPRLTGWNELPGTSCGATVSARGRCLWRGGRNAFPSPYCNSLAPANATHLHCRTHSVTHHVPRSRRLCTHRAVRTRQARTLFFAYRFFFVAYLYGVPYFCSRMTNQHRNRSKVDVQAQLDQVLAWTDNNPMKKTLLPILQAEVARFEQAEASAARAAAAKAKHEAKCAAYSALPFFRRLFATNPAV